MDASGEDVGEDAGGQRDHVLRYARDDQRKHAERRRAPISREIRKQTDEDFSMRMISAVFVPPWLC